jgi:PEP-CTERM/exosortase A-associated glycosyltransferase
MKILHILDHSIPLHSGYTFRTRSILEEQQKLGWETFQVTSAKHQANQADIETIDNFTFYRSSQPKAWIRQLPVLNQLGIVQTLMERLDEIIPQIKPDILHAHSPALNGIAALRMAKKYKLPLVYECRAFWEDAAVDHGTTGEGSPRYKLSKMLETYVFNKCDAITVICHGLRNDIINRKIPAEKITVIANAVDVDKFSFGESAEPELLRALHLNNKRVLGFIGSFYAYEGLSLLINALPSILKTCPDVRLLLVGGGPQEKQITDLVKELKLDDFVILTGRVAHNQVQRYYNLVDIFVYPRLSMRLTDLVTPLKPLEAMAQGRLVLASDVGGHHELIIDRKTGYLFKADDRKSLEETLIFALADQGNWESIRREGRRYVETERTWKVSVANYQTVYNAVLTAHKR